MTQGLSEECPDVRMRRWFGGSHPISRVYAVPEGSWGVPSSAPGVIDVKPMLRGDPGRDVSI